MIKIKNILVADDHELIVKGICEILKQRFVIEKLRTFTSAKSILDDVKKNRYEMYVLDLEFQDMSGFELIKLLRKRHAEARIIVVTMHDELWNVNHLLELDVNGIVLKKASSDYLAKAVNAVMEGKQFCCPRFEQLKKRNSSFRKRQRARHDQPSRAELSVLKYIADGYSSKEIAEKLFVTEDTIESHRKSLFLKVGAKNAAQLVSIAIRQRLLD